MISSKSRTIMAYIAGIVTGAVVAGSMLICENRAVAGDDLAAKSNPSSTKTFADVPANHWAASAISDLKTCGILQGSPQASFDGSRYVTRYETAVLLDRLIHYMEDGRKPLNPISVDPKTIPAIPASSAKTSLMFLSTNGFIEPGSILLVAPGTKPVTADQMTITLSKTVNRITDRSLPPNAH